MTFDFDRHHAGVKNNTFVHPQAKLITYDELVGAFKGWQYMFSRGPRKLRSKKG